MPGIIWQTRLVLGEEDAVVLEVKPFDLHGVTGGRP